MKNLDFKNYDLKELSRKENKKSAEGGFGYLTGRLLEIVILIIHQTNIISVN